MLAMNPTPIRPIRIFILAPAMFCWGLEQLVSCAQPHLRLAGTAHTLDAARQALPACEAHVVAVDLDAGDGVGALEELARLGEARLLALADSADAMLVERAVVAGARGFVRKTETPERLLRAIEKVHDGELWLPPVSAGSVFLGLARRDRGRGGEAVQMRIASLTPRERETVAAVAQDAAASGKVLASRLRISEHTLRNHLSTIYGKLGVANRLDLYAYATRHRLDEELAVSVQRQGYAPAAAGEHKS